MFIHSRRAGEKEAGGRDLGVEESEEEGQIYYLKDHWLPGARWEGRMNRRNREDFQGSKTILYETTKVNTYHYILFKTHRIYNIKREP